MVTYVNQTYGGDHFSIYTKTDSSCCTPETNIMLYINCTSIQNLLKEEKGGW